MSKQQRKRQGKKNTGPKDDFEQTIVDLARVTRVMGGGKRMRFRACVVIGNRKGSVGLGIAKAKDVSTAVDKAARQARKHIIQVPIVHSTIPHNIEVKYSSAKVLLKSARLGRGLIAGGAIRSVLDLAGVPNVVAKMMGSRNKINNVHAVVEALQKLRTEEAIKQIKS